MSGCRDHLAIGAGRGDEDPAVGDLDLESPRPRNDPDRGRVAGADPEGVRESLRRGELELEALTRGQAVPVATSSMDARRRLGRGRLVVEYEFHWPYHACRRGGLRCILGIPT